MEHAVLVKVRRELSEILDRQYTPSGDDVVAR